MYQVKINNGQYTFDETTRYYLHQRAEILANNVTAFFETMLQIDGELIGQTSDPATDVQARFRNLQNIFYLSAPVKIEIINLETSKVEQTFDPANFSGTPKMRELVQIPTEGGDQSSRIKYQASFYIRKPSLGNSNDPSKDTTSLVRSVEEISVDGAVQKIIWTAQATGKTLDQAKALVMSFRPTGYSNLEQDVTADYDTFTYKGVWTWEKAGDKAFTFDCRVTWTKAGHGWLESKVVGTGKKPNFHRTRYSAGIIEVSYKASSTQRASILGAPPPHFTESGDYLRDKTKEKPALPPELDPVTGIYTVEHTEFWYYTGETQPVPNHSTHANPFPNSGNGGKFKT